MALASEMRAFLVLADQPGAVERCGGGDAVGIARGGGQRIRAAHAVAVGADGAFLRRRLGIDECQHVGEILHHRRDGHLGADRAHAGLFGAALGGDVGAVFRVFAGAVVQVGQHDVIADGAEPAGHVVEFVADAGGVHQHEDHGMRAVAVGMDDEGLHLAGAGLDVANFFDHGRIPFGASGCCWRHGHMLALPGQAGGPSGRCGFFGLWRGRPGFRACRFFLLGCPRSGGIQASDASDVAIEQDRHRKAKISPAG